MMRTHTQLVNYRLSSPPTVLWKLEEDFQAGRLRAEVDFLLPNARRLTWTQLYQELTSLHTDLRLFKTSRFARYAPDLARLSQSIETVLKTAAAIITAPAPTAPPAARGSAPDSIPGTEGAPTSNPNLVLTNDDHLSAAAEFLFAQWALLELVFCPVTRDREGEDADRLAPLRANEPFRSVIEDRLAMDEFQRLCDMLLDLTEAFCRAVQAPPRSPKAQARGPSSLDRALSTALTAFKKEFIGVASSKLDVRPKFSVQSKQHIANGDLLIAKL